MISASGLGRFLKLSETQGSYASHPLGGCRMAPDAGLGVVDHRREAFGNEGLFCMDSSAIPTSLGVNPSLTISAVCERAASELVSRATDYGLPAPPPGFAPSPPGEIVGDRVEVPADATGSIGQVSSATIDIPRRRRKRKRRKRKKKGKGHRVR